MTTRMHSTNRDGNSNHQLNPRMQTWIHSLLIIMFMAYVSINASSSIREEMAAIQTPGQLQQYYAMNKDNPYKTRYCLKYIPGFLERMGIKTAPPWLYEAVGQALNSSYDPLIREAICLCGLYRMQEHVQQLEALFVRSPTRFAASAGVLRSSIVQSLQRIGGVAAAGSMVNLLDTYSRNCILNPEFEELLYAVDRIVVSNTGNTGGVDTSCLRALDRLGKAARQNLRQVRLSPSAPSALETMESQSEGILSNDQSRLRAPLEQKSNPIVQKLQDVIIRIDETRNRIAQCSFSQGRYRGDE
ncbi:MAG: hypothetical protein JW795_04025 [Chitinivibrionales bacterium]|nr:hypothetical protein [Chitinivibrionales bacterium]